MKIDVYCVTGSPTGVIPADMHLRGVGGAELALLTWAEQMAARGHSIAVYNDPRTVGELNGARFLPRRWFDPGGDRDVFIAFRGGNHFLEDRVAPVQVFWSCDQYTTGDYDTDVFPFVDLTVCISPYHVAYFKEHYPSSTTCPLVHIDLGVRTWEYDFKVAKVPGQAIYCSVPDRGLDIVARLWPQVMARVPTARLIITGDYRLWGAPHAGDGRHRAMLAPLPGVDYRGKVPRKELVMLQKQSDIMFYPCTYDELFCIAAAECQVAGAVPVTTSQGALATTNKYGIQRTIGPWFVDTAVELLTDRELLQDKQHLCTVGASRQYRWETICAKWEGQLRTAQSGEIP